MFSDTLQERIPTRASGPSRMEANMGYQIISENFSGRTIAGASTFNAAGRNGLGQHVNAGKSAAAGSSVHNRKISGVSAGADSHELKRIANGTSTDKKTVGASGIISSSNAYAESLKNSRLQSKETSNAVKKVRYNFKNISSQIMRSKTSQSAKQVVSRAKREVLRLKRAKAGGQYDEDEVNAALEHAKSMERIAKKKVAHLQQEEMIKITDKPGTASVAEDFEEHPEKLGDGNSSEETGENGKGAESDGTGGASGNGRMTAPEVAGEELRTEMDAFIRYTQTQMEEMSDDLAEETAENLTELMSEMSDKMTDLMDQMNAALEELDLTEMLIPVPKEMTEHEFKMYEIKHRTDEMKDIAKADKEYLKVVFDKYNKMRNAAAAGSSSGNPGGSSGVSVPSTPVTYSFGGDLGNPPISSAGAGMSSMGIDFSI